MPKILFTDLPINSCAEQGIALPEQTAPYHDMDLSSKNDYLQQATDAINSYCDLMGC
jgi:hypothetical protein